MVRVRRVLVAALLAGALSGLSAPAEAGPPLRVDRQQLITMLEELELYVERVLVPAVPRDEAALARLYASSVAGQGPFWHDPGERFYPATWAWKPEIKAPLSDALMVVTRAKRCVPELVVVEEAIRKITAGQTMDMGEPEQRYFLQHVNALRFRVDMLKFAARRVLTYIPRVVVCAANLDDYVGPHVMTWPDFGDVVRREPVDITVPARDRY